MLKFIAHVKEALLNFSSSKLRSTLALLGILVGTASVVAMVSGGELATNEALKQFKILGTDLLSVSLNDEQNEDHTASKTSTNISLNDAIRVSSANANIEEVAPYTQVYTAIQFEGHPLNGNVLGVTNSFANITHIQLKQGRLISSFDKYASFCLIGEALFKRIKEITYANPLGKQLQIGSSFFTIIGIADTWPENNFVYANINNSVLVPILASTTLSQYANINNIILRLKPNADLEKLNADITSYMNVHAPGKRLFFRSAKELIQSMGKQSKILTIFLGLIGSISLIVGGIGVMNIMLVSVVERRREIGIRRAVGATKPDIQYLFLIEAIMLSLVGGTLGVFVGLLIAYCIAIFSHWEFIIFLWPPLIGFSVSVLIGIFFGFYPAYKASQLDPIEALRSE